MSSYATSDEPQASRRRGRGCCGTGCLLAFVLLLLIGAAGAALYFRVPQRIGLIKPAAERLLSSTPDREAAAAIVDELALAGLDTQGMEIYVVPYQDGRGAVAYVVLDASQGFSFPQGSSDPLLGFLLGLAQGGASQRYGLRRVAVEYKSFSGASLVTLTAPTQAIQDYADGKITRQALLKAIEGNANWGALLTEGVQ